MFYKKNKPLAVCYSSLNSQPGRSLCWSSCTGARGSWNETDWMHKKGREYTCKTPTWSQDSPWRTLPGHPRHGSEDNVKLPINYRNPHWPTLRGPCSHSPFCPPSSLDGCPPRRLPWAPWASQTTALFSPHCNYCLIVCSCIRLHSVRAGTETRSGLLTCAFPNLSIGFWLTERPKKKMLNQ